MMSSNMVYYSLVIYFYVCIVQNTQSTIVRKCESDVTIANQVMISNCELPPCLLKRNGTTRVEIKFTPDRDVASLYSNVLAWMLSIPFPYLGIDGTSACNDIYTLPDGAKAKCPLKRGQQYLYKQALTVPAAYPKLKVRVNWALKDGRTNDDVFCFEVVARISSS